jgi:penicillin-binding protein 1A
MATAYATFANRGVRVDPVFVTKITKRDGAVVYEHHHEQHRAISEQTADEVTAALQQVVVRGTGTRARLADRPVAGKTGTGQEWRDAWFVGFTPDVVTAVWMGFPQEGQISMKPPATPMRVTGGSWPAQIWHLFMDPATAGTPHHPYPEVVPRKSPEHPVIELDDLTLPKVPNVSGETIERARAILESYGYLVLERAVDVTTMAPGLVVEQTPGGGGRLALGATVTVDVASGGVLTSVPDVLGLPLDAARAALGEAGFDTEIVEQEGGQVGVIWAQTPGAGTGVAGTVVQIWVTPEASASTTVPDDDEDYDDADEATTTTTNVGASNGVTTTVVSD